MASPKLNKEKGDIYIEDGNAPVEAPELYWISQFWCNINKREIFICGEINEEFGNQFLITFNYLLSKSNEPIKIWLSTPGGDVEAAFMFYDLVTSSPAPVTIIGTGGVLSAGVLMLACGHKVYVTENCSVMNHESTFSADGALRHSEIKQRRGWEDWVSDRFVVLLGKCTAKRNPEKDENYWRKITAKKAEYWVLGGAAIIADGLADGLFNRETIK